MKHLNDHKIFESKKHINIICKQYGIGNYTINNDGSIDVDGDVDLEYMIGGLYLAKLPLKFNRVSGYFDCSNNSLTSLEFCPICRWFFSVFK